MKYAAFDLYVYSLRLGPVRMGFLKKDVALDCLRRMTGQDFGYDSEKWEAWGKEHPELAYPTVTLPVRRRRRQLD